MAQARHRASRYPFAQARGGDAESRLRCGSRTQQEGCSTALALSSGATARAGASLGGIRCLSIQL